MHFATLFRGRLSVHFTIEHNETLNFSENANVLLVMSAMDWNVDSLVAKQNVEKKANVFTWIMAKSSADAKLDLNS